MTALWEEDSRVNGAISTAIMNTAVLGLFAAGGCGTITCPSASQHGPVAPAPPSRAPCSCGILRSSPEVEGRGQDRGEGKSEPRALPEHRLQPHRYQEGTGLTTVTSSKPAAGLGPEPRLPFSLPGVEFSCVDLT